MTAAEAKAFGFEVSAVSPIFSKVSVAFASLFVAELRVAEQAVWKLFMLLA